MEQTMEKQAFLEYLVDPNTLKNLFLGFSTGALGMLGTLGTANLIASLGKKIIPKPKLPEYIQIELPGEEEQPLEKKSDDPYYSPKRFGEVLAWGAGLPTGAYAAYKLLNYLNKSNLNIDYIKHLHKLEKEIEGKYRTEAKDEKLKKQGEALNKYTDDEKTIISQSYLKGFSKGAKSILEKKSFEGAAGLDLLPLIYGGAIPLGFLSGYYLLKEKYPVEEASDIPEPEIYFGKLHKDKKNAKRL